MVDTGRRRTRLRRQPTKPVSFFARLADARRRRRSDAIPRHPVTLEFRDTGTARLFTDHYNRFVVGKVAASARTHAALDLVFGLLLASDPSFSFLGPPGRQPDPGWPRVAVFGFAVLASSAAAVLSALARPAHARGRLQHSAFVAHACRLAAWAGAVTAVAAGTRPSQEHASVGGPPPLFIPEVAFVTNVAFAFHYSGMRHRTALAAVSVGVATLAAALVTASPFPGGASSAAALLSTLLSTAVPAALALAALLLAARANERRVQVEFLVRLAIADDRRRADEVLMRMLPRPIIQQLEQGRSAHHLKAQVYEECSLMFARVQDFERIVFTIEAGALIDLLHGLYRALDDLIAGFPRVEKIEAAGDTYICAAGAPEPDADHAGHLAEYALAIVKFAAQDRRFCLPDGRRVQFKIGLHSGPAVGGVVGSVTVMYKLFGDTVNTASRMCSYSRPGHVHASADFAAAVAGAEGLAVAPIPPRPIKGKGVMACAWIFDNETLRMALDAGGDGADLARSAVAAGAASVATSGASTLLEDSFGWDAPLPPALAPSGPLDGAGPTALPESGPALAPPSARGRAATTPSAASTSTSSASISASMGLSPRPSGSGAAAPSASEQPAADAVAAPRRGRRRRAHDVGRALTSADIDRAIEIVEAAARARAVEFEAEATAASGNALPSAAAAAAAAPPPASLQPVFSQSVAIDVDAASLAFADSADEADFVKLESKQGARLATAVLVAQCGATASACFGAIIGNGLAARADLWAAAAAVGVAPLAAWCWACGGRRVDTRFLNPWLAAAATAAPLAGIAFVAAVEVAHARLPARGAPLLAALATALLLFAYRLLWRTVAPFSLALAAFAVATQCALADGWAAPLAPALALLALRGAALSAAAEREKGVRHTYMLRGVTFREQQRHRLVLENTFPKPVVRRLLAGEPFFREALPDVTVLFADVKRFTDLSATMSAVKLLTLLNLLYRAFDHAVRLTGTHKLDTIGDCVVVAAGIPGTARRHAEAVVAYAIFMLRQLRLLKSRFPALRAVDMRIGVHSGPAVAGVVDARRPRYLVWGPTVAVANKMESAGVAGRVQVSAQTRARLGDGFCAFDDEPRPVAFDDPVIPDFMGFLVRLQEDEGGSPAVAAHAPASPAGTGAPLGGKDTSMHPPQEVEDEDEDDDEDDEDDDEDDEGGGAAQSKRGATSRAGPGSEPTVGDMPPAAVQTLLGRNGTLPPIARNPQLLPQAPSPPPPPPPWRG